MVEIKKYIRFAVWMALSTILLLSSAVQADYCIRDDANLFYSDEVESIRQLAEAIDDMYHMNVCIVTDQKKDGLSSSEKSDKAYEAEGYAQNDASGGICLIIDMGNREVNMTTDRSMMRFITDAREEDIYDVGYSYLTGGEYGDAMIAMLEQVEVFLEKGIPGNQYLYDPETGKISRYYSLTTMDIVIALAGALLTALITTLIVISGYKKIAKYRYDLNANSQIRIVSSSDRLINQFVTKRRIHTDSPGSGSGHGTGGRTTTHRSSSGRSFGGGHGRKF